MLMLELGASSDDPHPWPFQVSVVQHSSMPWMPDCRKVQFSGLVEISPRRRCPMLWVLLCIYTSSPTFHLSFYCFGSDLEQRAECDVRVAEDDWARALRSDLDSNLSGPTKPSSTALSTQHWWNLKFILFCFRGCDALLILRSGWITREAPRCSKDCNRGGRCSSTRRTRPPRARAARPARAPGQLPRPASDQASPTLPRPSPPARPRPRRPGAELRTPSPCWTTRKIRTVVQMASDRSQVWLRNHGTFLPNLMQQWSKSLLHDS